jgi:hypothetical protein
VATKKQPSKARTRITAIIAELRKQAIQTKAFADDLEAILNEKPTTGQQATKLLDFFVSCWGRRHPGETYVENRPKEIGQLKRLLGTLTADDVRERMLAFFAARDEFYARAGYSLGAFVSTVNKLRGASSPRPDGFTLAVGCQHQPPCATDVAHTQRALREVRG